MKAFLYQRESVTPPTQITAVIPPVQISRLLFYLEDSCFCDNYKKSKFNTTLN